MGKGYISLFFEDSGYKIPQEDIKQVKSNIWDSYKARSFIDPEDKENIEVFTYNKLMQEMESQLSIKGQQQLSNPIEYWNISVGAMYQAIDKEADLLTQISQANDFISNSYISISNAIEQSKGLIPDSLLKELESVKASLEKIANKFGGNISEPGFKGAYWGSLRGCILRAQGCVHEVASAIAAKTAKDKVNKEFAKTGQDIQIFVAATGGNAKLDPELMAALEENDINPGRTANSKNDLTFYAKDGNGKVIWISGVSLKSTSANHPEKVHIASSQLTTLLNKYFSNNQEEYLNLACGLAVGDIENARWKIKELAENRKNALTITNTQLNDSWRKITYAAIYSQILDMFAGFGTALNNIQYVIINSKAIPILHVFQKLEELNNQKKVGWNYIKGIEIAGIKAASRRDNLVYMHKTYFKSPGESGLFTSDQMRIERSKDTWSNIYSTLQGTKISISLKYNQIFASADTR